MNVIASLFSAALYAMLLQNLIFTGGYGASEAIRMSAKPKQLLPLSAFIIYFATVGSVICVLLEKIPQVKALSTLWHSLVFVGVMIALYLVTLFVVYYGIKAKKRTVRRLGIAAFNTLVMAVPFINHRAAFGIGQAIGVGIGSALAFVLATLMINFGLRRLQENEDIPNCFKGTPAIFVYVSILSLAFTGFFGNALIL